MIQPRRIPWPTVLAAAALLMAPRAAAQSGTVTDDAFLSSNAVTQSVNANGHGIALVVSGSNATVGFLHVGSTTTYINTLGGEATSSGVPTPVRAIEGFEPTRVFYLLRKN